MGRYILKRLLWMVPTLLGITFVTFLLMDLAPGDPVLRALDPSSTQSAHGDARARAQQAQRLAVRHGLVDPSTGERLGLAQRYGRWLANVGQLEFAGPGADNGRLLGRIGRALPVTALVNALALIAALCVVVPLAGWVGLRTGGLGDRAVGFASFVVYGVPEFLIATLLLLVCGSFLPVAGLRSDDAAAMGGIERLLDLGAHIVLPVTTLALGYGVVLFRFLRESVARAAGSEFVRTLRAWGASAAEVRRCAVRNGLSPIVTLLGTMLPALVSGTVVVETIFSLPGVGWLTWSAVQERDLPMVMALTLLVGVVTAASVVLSDILQRVVDPRVELR